MVAFLYPEGFVLTSQLSELLEAINRLTKPNPVPLMQKEIAELGIAARMFKRTDPSLLDQLKAAIGSNIGEKGAAGRLANERTPLDIAAFSLYDQIDGRIRAWMLDAGIRPSTKANPGDILRRWYILYMQKQVEETDIHRHALVVERWVSAIEDILDPPTRQELTQACPKCERRWVTVGEGEETQSRSALWAVWREDPDLSYATCVGCDTTWLGVGNMRLLRIQLDDKEKVNA